MRIPGAIDIGNIRHTWRGEWDEGTVYFLNDVVKYNGQKFVCIDTELSDNRKFGKIYKPTVANEYWELFSYGYLWRGGWNYRDEYYPGDVIKWNGDWYVCNTYNFGGHPIYENGGLTSKWTKIMSSGNESNKRHHHLWFGNYEPMGWTRNMCFNGLDRANIGDSEAFWTINGNFEGAYCGRSDGYRSRGSSSPNTLTTQQSCSFDWWDYYDGYNTSITGGIPKCVQVLAGFYHMVHLFDNGEIYMSGHNNQGYLGDGTQTARRWASKFGRTTGGRRSGALRDVFFIKVATNNVYQEYLYNHVLALDNQGRVWSCGDADYGQLGNGTADAYIPDVQLIPQKFFDNARIVDIWVGGTGSYSNSYALDENGQLWAWGYNAFGSLGIGNYPDVKCVRPVRQPIDWTRYGGIKKLQITGNSTNNSHGGMVLTNDNSLWGWGGTWARGGAIRGEAWTDTYFYAPERYKNLLWNRKNTAGDLNQTQLKQIGVTMDVVDSVEDFWGIGFSQGDTLIIKERITGSIFGIGYNNSQRLPFSRQQGLQDQVDAEANNPDIMISYPTLLNLGNFKELKDVITTLGNVGTGGLAWLNADGRVFASGDGDTPRRGVGRGYKTDELSTLRLPWESDPTIASNATQVRSLNNASMITHIAGSGALVAITQDNEVRTWGNYNTTYFMTPIARGTMHRPVRLNNYS